MVHVQAEGLSLTYDGPDGPIPALHQLDIEVRAGEPVAIIGPSGCGKSSLLLVLAGLRRASSGSVVIGGQPVVGTRHHTALILQDFGLLDWKTVTANAALGLRIRGIPRQLREERVAQALQRVGLAAFANSYPGQLSGGMRQRLALARSLALDADLLLMDEPLSALDALTREDLQEQLLATWCERKHTALLVTHSIEEAVLLGRRIFVMSPRPGRIAAVVENPGMGSSAYRNHPDFLVRCAEVRALLIQVGALHPTRREAMT